MLYYINFICICIECNDFPLIYNLTIRIYYTMPYMVRWHNEDITVSQKRNDNGNNNDDNEDDSQQ